MSGAAVRVRPVERGDVDAVVALVHDLAAYERAPDECTLTAEQLHAGLFGARPAVFGHVAEVDGGDSHSDSNVGGVVVGMALWFLTYSTWNGGHGIHLEDYYVRPEHRGAGIGAALMAELAAECIRRGYGRLEFSVLDWNEPALRVYRAMGAEPMNEWTVHRITGPALTVLAERTGRAGVTGAPGPPAAGSRPGPAAGA